MTYICVRLVLPTPRVHTCLSAVLLSSRLRVGTSLCNTCAGSTYVIANNTCLGHIPHTVRQRWSWQINQYPVLINFTRVIGFAPQRPVCVSEGLCFSPHNICVCDGQGKMHVFVVVVVDWRVEYWSYSDVTPISVYSWVYVWSSHLQETCIPHPPSNHKRVHNSVHGNVNLHVFCAPFPRSG